MSSLEYRALVTCHEQLVAGVKTSVDIIADALFQNGVLSDSQRDDIRAYPAYMTKDQKAREIVATLENRVKDFPSKYGLFMDILRDKSQQNPQVGKLAAQLENRMTELLDADDTQSVVTIQSYISNESEEEDGLYVQFKCDCGQCEIQGFLNGRDCPQAPAMSPPQLSVWSKGSNRRQPTPVDMRWTEYRVVMKRQAARMNTSYKSLLSNTMNELKQRHSLQFVKDQVRTLISPRGAKKSMYNKMYSGELKGRLRDIKTYDQLEKYIDRNFCSWFNIDLIADLRVALLGYQTGDETVSSYREDFAEYMKRSCFKRIIDDSCNQEECTKIVSKVLTDFERVDRQQLDIFEHKLRQYVQLPECTTRVEDNVLIFPVNQAEPERLILPAQHAHTTRTPRHQRNVEGAIQLLELQSEPSARDENRMLSQIQLGRRTRVRQPKHRSKNQKRILKKKGCAFTCITTTLLSISMSIFLALSRRYQIFVNQVQYEHINLGSTTANFGITQFNHSVTVSYAVTLIFSKEATNSTVKLYLTDCKHHSKLIFEQGTIEAGTKKLFDRQYLAVQSDYYVIFEAEVERTDCYGVFEVKGSTDRINETVEECVSQNVSTHIVRPAENSFFYFSISTSEHLNYTVTGKILTYKTITNCTISPDGEQCTIQHTMFSKENTVCIIAETEDPSTDISYGMQRKFYSLGVKALYVSLFSVYLVVLLTAWITNTYVLGMCPSFYAILCIIYILTQVGVSVFDMHNQLSDVLILFRF